MDTMTDLMQDAKREIGGGRPWNPYLGAFVPYLKTDITARLVWQRDQAVIHLANELNKPAPRIGRMNLLKRCERLAKRRLKDFVRFKRIIRRCDLIPASQPMAEKVLSKDVVALYYNGGGVIGLVHGRIQSEMLLTNTVWKMRRADSKLQFLTRMYGDLVCHLG